MCCNILGKAVRTGLDLKVTEMIGGEADGDKTEKSVRTGIDRSVSRMYGGRVDGNMVGKAVRNG